MQASFSKPTTSARRGSRATRLESRARCTLSRPPFRTVFARSSPHPEGRPRRTLVSLFIFAVRTSLLSTSLYSWYMGADALQGNGITLKLLYLVRDRSLTPPDEPLGNVRKSRLVLFVAIQLVAFGATFAITQTIGTCLVMATWTR